MLMDLRSLEYKKRCVNPMMDLKMKETSVLQEYVKSKRDTELPMAEQRNLATMGTAAWRE